MNEQEARQRCEQLQAEHPDRATHTWVPVPGEDGEWSVAKINIRLGPAATGAEIRSEPNPPPKDPNTLAPWNIHPGRGYH